ncbi:hypothetical protein [Rubrivivax albus]|uniref:Uncharacterized protein n=1 Tax=Rubrivivax albus TaxID=2499835 RepID=A0A437JNF3_9BURK|nr:hypothetical protein [Rubrivivax albus]RVT48384.1 hypothetical protein ENE75_22065 [Rubrivivax albus]
MDATTTGAGPHTGIADAAHSPADLDPHKTWATWQARAALRGHQLRRMADGRWLAFRHGWSRELDDSEVEAWLQRIGAPA